MEAVNGKIALNEITSEKAYTDYYSNIPREIYDLLMSSTTDMTPFHKAILDFYLKGKQTEKKVEVLKTAGDLWRNSSQEARQYIINAVKDDWDYIQNRIPGFLKTIAKMKSHTENSYVTRGLEVLYSDENIEVTCTKSYSASCRKYGKSHWCTASDMWGDHDGFEMFKRYTKDSFLIQFIDKHDIENSYQAQYFFVGNHFGWKVICDWEDEEYNNIRPIENLFTKYGLSYLEFYQTKILPNRERLVEETRENLEDEIIYYTRKRRVKELRCLNQLKKRMAGKEFNDRIMGYIHEMIQDNACWRFYGETFIDFVQGYPKEVMSGNFAVAVAYNGDNDLENTIIGRKLENEHDTNWIQATRYVLIFDKNLNLIARIQGIVNNAIHNVLLINTVTDRDDAWEERPNFAYSLLDGKMIYHNKYGKPIRRDGDDIVFETENNIFGPGYGKVDDGIDVHIYLRNPTVVEKIDGNQ